MAEPDLNYVSTGPPSQMTAAHGSHRRPSPRIAALGTDQTRWMLGGACRHEDPELFLPISASGPAQGQISQSALRFPLDHTLVPHRNAAQAAKDRDSSKQLS
jgi:hypothetical protein